MKRRDAKILCRRLRREGWLGAAVCKLPASYQFPGGYRPKSPWGVLNTVTGTLLLDTNRVAQSHAQGSSARKYQIVREVWLRETHHNPQPQRWEDLALTLPDPDLLSRLSSLSGEFLHG